MFEKKNIDSHKKRKEHTHNTKENHQTTKGKEKERNKKDYKINWKTRLKMAINTLSINNYLKCQGTIWSNQKT